MTHFQPIPELPVIKTVDGKLTDEQIANILDSIRDLINLVNGKITFGDAINSAFAGHIDGQVKEVVFARADTDYVIPHKLGHAPLGAMVVRTSKDDAVVRCSAVSSNNVTMRCNVADTVAWFVVI